MPIDNRLFVSKLVQSGRLRLAVDPGALGEPRPLEAPWDRIEGMLFGLAIGDSLGNTSESMVPAERRRVHGEIRDYLPNRYAEGRRVGLPSDDTQLAFWTLEQLLNDDGLRPEKLAARFESGGRIFGIGATVRSFLWEWSQTRDWLKSAQESAGNGALMRIAPVLLPHLRTPGAGMWADAALAGAVTHNDYCSNAACVAFVAVLWEALGAEPPVAPGFWLDRFTKVARLLEGEATRYTPRAPRYATRSTSCWAFTKEVVEASPGGRRLRGRGLQRLVLGSLPPRDGAVRALRPRAARERPRGGGHPGRERHQGQRHGGGHRRGGRRGAPRGGCAAGAVAEGPARADGRGG